MKSIYIYLVVSLTILGVINGQSELDNTAQSAAASLQAAVAEKEHNALADVEIWLKEAKTKMSGVVDKAGSELKQIAATTSEFVQGKAGEISQQIQKIAHQHNHTEHEHNDKHDHAQMNSTNESTDLKFQQ